MQNNRLERQAEATNALCNLDMDVDICGGYRKEWVDGWPSPQELGEEAPQMARKASEFPSLRV
jgi:hypothetical protein